MKSIHIIQLKRQCLLCQWDSERILIAVHVCESKHGGQWECLWQSTTKLQSAMSCCKSRGTSLPRRPWGIWPFRFIRGGEFDHEVGSGGGTHWPSSVCTVICVYSSNWFDEPSRTNISNVPCPGVGLFDHFLCPQGGFWIDLPPPPPVKSPPPPGGGGGEYPGAWNW